MKRCMIWILVLTICLLSATGTMAETDRTRGQGGSRNDASMALLNEGIALMNGDGVDRDYEAAMARFLAAEEAGNRKAARYVGMMYEQGLGVQLDLALAAEYYEKGVTSGDLTNGYYLGLLYEHGLGVEQDYVRAAELFGSVAGSENRSATGVVDAGYELARLYEQGLGVEQDIEKALALYQEAAEDGSEDAAAALERLDAE